MKIKEITSKTALSPSKLPGLDYALNPYSGCRHQCKYCYVPTVLHLPQATWGEIIFVKRNLPLVLAKELPRKKPGIIGISTVTDPYQPIEKKYKIARYCLEQLKKYDFSIQIQTKSDLILRDIDVIKQCFQPEIMISIGTSNDDHRKILEPHAPSISKRIQILDELKNNQQIKTSVFLGPLYPNMTGNDIKTLLDTFIEKKVTRIMIDTFHLKPGLQSYLRLILKKDKSLDQGFKKHVFSPSQRYEKTANKIKEYVSKKQGNISVINAF